MAAYRPPSDPATERLLLRLVEEALELPPEERDLFLARHERTNAELLVRSRALLAACQRAESDVGFLAANAAEFAEPLVRSVDAEEAIDSFVSVPRVAAALEGTYDLVREIGRGGNAVVHLARDVRHARDVAVKIIRAAVTDEAQRVRFFREIAIVAQLRHPYVVPLIDSGAADGVLYYVMPFVDGESLRHSLDRTGAMPMSDVLALARDVAEALDAAHAAGIVHRDIKPQNILLDGTHALVADFGIALALESTGEERLTERGVAVGTPAYMSPEQASADERIDGRSDVYSLACVVYEMLTGEVPFPGATPQTIRAKHLHAPVPDVTILRPALPAGVQEVMQRALAKSPADRFFGAGAFVTALAAAAKGSPPRRRVRTRFVVALAGASLALFGIWRMTPRASSRPATAAAVASPVDQRRIAVLYFDNLSSEPEVGRVARGLTEDLIDELSAVRGLHVISPNGVRPFRDHPAPVDSIARALGVGTVVGGSVSASPTVLRATVRLVDPTNGEQLQSRSLEVPRGDALKLRQAIVAQVTTFLRQRLGQEVKLREQRSETQSLAAWERVRQADELTRDGNEASNQYRDDEARDLFTRADSLYAAAQRLDPAWTAPLVGRGWAALRLALTAPASGDFGSDPTTGRMSSRKITEAVAFANHALALSAGFPAALGLRGFAKEWMGTSGVPGADTLLPQAEADLRATLDQQPEDARSWFALGELLSADGRFIESSAALANAYERDAYLSEARAVVSELIFVSLGLERFADAGHWCELGRAQYAGDPRFIACRLIVIGWSGAGVADLDRGWREIDRIERADSVKMFADQWGFFRLMVAAVAARSGLPDSARSIVQRVDAGHAGQPIGPPFREAKAYVLLLAGDRREAAQLLSAELRENPSAQRRIVRSPWFRTLVGDSTFGPSLTLRREGPARPR